MGKNHLLQSSYKCSTANGFALKALNKNEPLSYSLHYMNKTEINQRGKPAHATGTLVSWQACIQVLKSRYASTLRKKYRKPIYY